MIKIQKYREPVIMENWLVNADEIGTLSGDWLILGNSISEFDSLMATVIHLDSVDYFTSTKLINHARIFCINRGHTNGYLYWVIHQDKENN